MANKIQDRILKEIYLRANNEMTIEKISEILRLKESQIRHALAHLKHRELIVKRYELNPAGKNSPPYKKVFIKLKNFHYVREYLSKKGLH